MLVFGGKTHVSEFLLKVPGKVPIQSVLTEFSQLSFSTCESFIFKKD